MHLLVEAVDDWWQQLEAGGIAARYAVRSEPPADRPWGLRDCVLFDPPGSCGESRRRRSLARSSRHDGHIDRTQDHFTA